MISTHNVPYALKCIRYIFKKQIRRSFCLSQPGNFKEQRSSWVCKSPPASSNAETLARKSSTQQVEAWDVVWIGFSDVLTEPLSPRVKQRAVAALRMFVLFTMAHTFKSSGPLQSFAEPADTGEQVDISYGFLLSRSLCRF